MVFVSVVQSSLGLPVPPPLGQDFSPWQGVTPEYFSFNAECQAERHWVPCFHLVIIFSIFKGCINLGEFSPPE